MDRAPDRWDVAEATAIETIRGLVAKYRIKQNWHGKIGIVITAEGARGPQRLSEIERGDHLIRN